MARKFIFDHDEIRAWMEERGGKPAILVDTESSEDITDEADLLHIAFAESDDLEEISWEEFFERLEQNDLVLYYDDEGDPLDFGFIDKSQALVNTDETSDSEMSDGTDEDELDNNEYTQTPDEDLDEE